MEPGVVFALLGQTDVGDCGENICVPVRDDLKNHVMLFMVTMGEHFMQDNA